MEYRLLNHYVQVEVSIISEQEHGMYKYLHIQTLNNSHDGGWRESTVRKGGDVQQEQERRWGHKKMQVHLVESMAKREQLIQGWTVTKDLVHYIDSGFWLGMSTDMTISAKRCKREDQHIDLSTAYHQDGVKVR